MADPDDAPEGPGADEAAGAPRLSKADKVLKAEIAEMTTALEKVASEVEATRATHLALADDVRALRGEFAGFGDFRKRIEGYEEKVSGLAKSYALKAIYTIVATTIAIVVAVAGSAYYLGSRTTEMSVKVDQLTTSVKDLNETSKGVSRDIGDLRAKVGELSGSAGKTAPGAPGAVPDGGAARIERAIDRFEQVTAAATSGEAVGFVFRATDEVQGPSGDGEGRTSLVFRVRLVPQMPGKTRDFIRGKESHVTLVGFPAEFVKVPGPDAMDVLFRGPTDDEDNPTLQLTFTKSDDMKAFRETLHNYKGELTGQSIFTRLR